MVVGPRSGACSLVPLAKSSSAVGAPPLPQGQAEEDAQGEEQDGTHDAQTGEVVLQHPHPAGWASSHHHYRGLDDGVSAGIVGLLADGSGRWSSSCCWEALGWGWRVVVGRRCGRVRRDGPVLINPGDAVVGGGSVLQQGFVIHVLNGTRPLRGELTTASSGEY